MFLHKIYKFTFMYTRFQRIQTPCHSTNTWFTHYFTKMERNFQLGPTLSSNFQQR